jgi:hypothetical protein
MIDTISLYHSGRNGEDFNINFKEFNSAVSKKGQVNYYSNNFIHKDKDKRNIYIKNDLNRNYTLVTFSAPKLLYGNSLENIKLNDKDELLNILTGRLTGILEADFENWSVSRLDVTKNIEVKNNVSGYITALKKAYDIGQGRYHFTNVKDESLTVNNNSRRFVIYDKVKQELAEKEISRSKSKLYGNILRLEVQHKKARAIKTSFNKKYFFEDLFTEKSFQDFSKFQLQFFDKFYCNSGQYQLFIQDVALAELIFMGYSKRDLIRNFLTKKYISENDIDMSVIQDIMRPLYNSRQGLNKALKQIDQLARLGTDTVEDVLQEIRLKLVA